MDAEEKVMNEADESTDKRRLEEQLLRLRADFDNYRRRTAQHIQRLTSHAKEEFIKRLLPLADDFERALEALPVGDDSAREGFEMVSRKLFSFLGAEGVERVGTEGERFDPGFHEAVSVGESEEEGSVCEVLQSGYRIGEVVLRPAKVSVSVKKKVKG
jgi:molecular chaperone GrpE